MDLKRASHVLPQSSDDGKTCKCVCRMGGDKKLFGDNRRQTGGEEMADVDGNQTAVLDSSLGELTLTGYV